MPQPLSHYTSTASMTIKPGIICHERPVLSLQMMACVTHWASMEAEIGETLTTIAGIDSIEAAEELSRLATSNAQANLLLKHAHDKLPPDELEALKVLLDIFRSLATERNKLVHWLSGTSKQLSDGILLVNPKDWWKEMARFHEHKALEQKRARMREQNPNAEYPPIGNPKLDQLKLFKKILVYKQGDFERMGRDMNALYDGFWSLRWIVSVPRDKEEEFRRLRNWPRFQQGIERSRSRQNSALQERAGLLKRVRSRICRFLGH